MEKNLSNYIKCIERRIKESKKMKNVLLEQLPKMRKGEFIIPLEVTSYVAESYKLDNLKVVLEDLQEIITHQQETERTEDNTIESFWKSWS